MNKTITFTASLLLVWLIGYLLYVGRSLLIPVVIAIFIWHLLNTVNVYVKNIPYLGKRMPGWLARLVSLIIFILFLQVVAEIITNNVNEVIEASSRYQENLIVIFNKIDAWFNFKFLVNMDKIIKGLSVQALIVNIYGMFTTITRSAILIILYLAFLFVEQHYFYQKMHALLPLSESRALANNILTHIAKDTQTYLGLKTLLSLMTAIASWCIMKYVDLDFAEFWALLIFFLNFIPNIGAMIATAFPALLALIQFDGWIPFIIVSTGIGTIQFVIGNFLEPRYLSRSLNLSPLVILFSLSLWGSLWGILGMFLSVPITVMLMIIFAHFEKTRSIAVLLSQDGQVQKIYAKLPQHQL